MWSPRYRSKRLEAGSQPTRFGSLTLNPTSWCVRRRCTPARKDVGPEPTAAAARPLVSLANNTTSPTGSARHRSRTSSLPGAPPALPRSPSGVALAAAACGQEPLPWSWSAHAALGTEPAAECLRLDSAASTGEDAECLGPFSRCAQAEGLGVITILSCAQCVAAICRRLARTICVLWAATAAPCSAFAVLGPIEGVSAAVRCRNEGSGHRTPIFHRTCHMNLLRLDQGFFCAHTGRPASSRGRRTWAAICLRGRRPA